MDDGILKKTNQKVGPLFKLSHPSEIQLIECKLSYIELK